MIAVPSDPPLSLRWFLREVYAPLKLRGRSQNTMRLYLGSIGAFERFLGHDPLLADLSDDTVARFLSFRRAQEISPYTVEKDRCQLLAIWRFAARRQDAAGQPYVSTWPWVEREKLPKRIPLAWLDTELTLILRACEALRGTVGELAARVFWVALVRTCWITGERIGAVTRLEWRDIDLATGWLVFRAETRKGETADRGCELDAATVEALRAIKGRSGGKSLVFPWDRSPTYLWGRFGAILRKAGLPHDQGKFHRIRKSTASYYKLAGGDPTAFLGHSSPKVTAVYLDPRIVRAASPADLLPKV